MTSRPTPPGLGDATRRLEQLLDARPPLLLVSDFDGTLSPIVQDPMAAVIEPIARRAIARLARLGAARPGRLVVVLLSGRTARDVAGRVRVGGIRYLGNHGVERGDLARRGRPERMAVEVAPALAAYAAPATALAEGVATALDEPDWLFVERKGSSVAFHFRRAPDADIARLEVLKAIEAVEQALGGSGLVRLEGRRIVEVRPDLAAGKGAAVARLIEEIRPGAVMVLGDDISDAEAFEVVRSRRDRGELAGLAVAVHGAAETPNAVAAAADLELGAPRDAARLLSALASALERRLATDEAEQP